MIFRRRFEDAPPTGRAVWLAVGAALALTACEPRISNHGYVPDPERLAQVEPGVHSRLEVERLLGAPSSTSLFGRDAWLYISERREEHAFFAPEIVGRSVVAIAFDDRGIAREVASFSIEDGVAVDPVSRVTPTHGKQLGLLEQLFGNIGRFNTQGQ